MKLFANLILAVVMVAPLKITAQSILDTEHLSEVKAQINRPFYAAPYAALISEADKLLDFAPLSVMDKEATAASGDKHDYLSQARYAWPDPLQPNGLPYINRDGVSNPEIERLDRNALGKTASAIRNLSLAWYFSDNEKYAEKAVELIRVWFLDKDTRMNPNMEYAQVWPGKDNGKGRCYGLIDSYSFVDMLDGVQLLEKSKAFKAKDQKALRKWFSEFTEWMLNSKQGKEESACNNNHSVAYDAQLMAYALYTGNKKLSVKLMAEFPHKRIFEQISPDGSLPHELNRTLALHYSQYCMGFFCDMALMAKKQGVDLSSATSTDGRNILKCADFLFPYLGKSQNDWPYSQISGWTQAQQNLAKQVYRLGAYLAENDKAYIKAYKDNRVYDPGDIFNLIYVKASETDHAYAFAANQLKYAVVCADKARKEEKNASKRRFIPRSIDKDGSLAMVHPHDWCSGFFAGSLWQMYDYTNDGEWRECAVSWTWPIEEAKWHTGSHDLGFIINNSFGKAYDMTGEKSYQDVVLRAAKSLLSRFNSTVGCIRSWDHNTEVWKYPVIIDNMMNLELLFRATEFSGDSIYRKIAISHADNTLKNHFRDDCSSFHVVDYDPQTGKVRGKGTHQGNSDDSFWSRGQAWGLYGFAMCFRYTGDVKYLRQSEKIADFFINLPNMPADGIPYWDMGMETVKDCTSYNVNKEVPRDASAAAIAASGLYELSQYVNPEKGRKYRAFADKVLDSLARDYQTTSGGDYGFILQHSVGHHPGGSEIDVPLNYADYYYLEALRRKDVFVLNE